MEETGRVFKTDKNFATVRVEKKDECAKCGMCVFPKNAGYTEFYANNSVGAKAGDEVKIKTSDRGKFLGTLLVFGVPLLLIALAAVITFTAIKNEIFVLVLSAGFIAAWYTVLAVLDKKFRTLKTFSSEITEIIKEKNEKEKENGN